MRRRLTGLGLLGLILFLLGGIVYTWNTPRLLEISPAPQAFGVPAETALQFVFSRPMQAASVQEHLSIHPQVSGQYAWQGNTLTFAPDRPWPAGALVQVRLSPGSRGAGLFSIPISREQSWSFTVGHPLLVYLYPSDAPADLYTLNPLTGEIAQITDVPGETLDFSIDHGGERIYFSVNRVDGSSLYRWDRAAGRVALVFDCPQELCQAVQVSAQGDFLAYERTPLAGAEGKRLPQVWLLPVSASGEPSGAPRPVTSSGRSTQSPRWSPAGLLSYYDTGLSAYILSDPAHGEVARFASQTGLGGAWDPAGENYVITEIFTPSWAGSQALEDLQPAPSSHLLRYHRPDGHLLDLTGAEELDDAAPAFAPTGDRLAFARKFLDLARWTPGRQLWLARPDGSDAHPLTEEPVYNHSDFAWSPQGDELAYVRFNQDVLTEPPELWLVNADGSQARELVIGGYAPQWIP